MRRMLRAHGAEVDLVEVPCAEGGWQEARRRRVREIAAADPTAWCPDQYHNPDNVEAYGGLAHELLDQLGRIDVLVCSVGTGGHSAGISRVLRSHVPDLHLVGVDAVGSAIFGQPAASRLMRGLGSSIYPRNVDYDAFDEVHWVAPDEAVWACRALARSSYATGGWSVGAGWWPGGSPAPPRLGAGSLQSSRTGHSATSTPSSTTSSATGTACSPAVPPPTRTCWCGTTIESRRGGLAARQ